MMFRVYTILIAAALTAAATAAHAQLRGHGGPVRAVAVSPDGKSALTGSFDTSAIRWSLERNSATAVLRFHDGAVNAAVLLPDGRAVTSGEDARIVISRPRETKPVAVLEGHKAPVVGLAVSPDGKTLASASWDHTARLWPLASGDDARPDANPDSTFAGHAPGGAPRVLDGHKGNVNGVA
ncbi:MAG: WD40 repeat domain-containing protein, partial [Burkholderiales bacterium]